MRALAWVAFAVALFERLDDAARVVAARLRRARP